MNTASLDILEKTQLLPSQARAILQVMELELSTRESPLATKSEVREAWHSIELSIERLRTDIKGFESRMDGRIAGVEAKIVGMDGKIAGVDGKIASVDGKVTGMETKIASLDGKVTGMETKIASLDGKVTGVETKIASLDGKVTGVETKIASLDGKIAGVEAKIATMDGKITNMDLKITSLDVKITGVEGGLMRWVLTCMMGQTAVIATAVYFGLTHLRR